MTPDRTIAADARVFPKGALAFVETERPVDAAGAAMRPFSRFVLDQDAGGAIRTSARVDLYFGSGAYAENAAGRMRQPGRLYYLLLEVAPLAYTRSGGGFPPCRAAGVEERPMRRSPFEPRAAR